MIKKKFDIPDFYAADLVKQAKSIMMEKDPKPKTPSPISLDFGKVSFKLARNFGFCWGVENAVEIAYRAIEENPDKNVYLLSEMIHNPTVNEDLVRRGIRFLKNTDGSDIIPISTLESDDIVIVPAFGTTVQITKELKQQGINPLQYDTTCPFVTKVWKRGNKLARADYSLVIHGKYKHEETRATFSQNADNTPTVVVLNIEEAQVLADIIKGERPKSDFEKFFSEKSTPAFDPEKDLVRFGVINQTTMLATETQEVMDVLKQAVIQKYGEENIKDHIADTRDTLCYATNENQTATLELAKTDCDLAIVVGGYNSSNTMHLVEILEHKMPTYHIRDASEFEDAKVIQHFNQWDKKLHQTDNWLPFKDIVNIAITSGASCPDILVDEVILKIAALFNSTKNVKEVLEEIK